MAVNYREAHQRIQAAKGRAADYDCIECSGPANHWAYSYAEPSPKYVSPKGQPYSDDPDAYIPLCIGCHRRFDIAHDARVREAAQKVGAARGAGNASRLKVDREYFTRMRGISRENADRLNNSPEYAEVMREARAKAVIGRKRRWEADPEYREKVSTNMKALAAKRRICAICNVEGSPGNLGRHQKKSGHTGWTERKE